MPKFKLRWTDNRTESWVSIIEAPNEAAARQSYEDGDEIVFDNANLDTSYTAQPEESELESVEEVKE
ncbi:MAG: hypothetical protein M1480_13745 [Bacteroidetes bacterium]|nr:hypothetical protein [Bacteroidota bacterium]